MEEANKLEILQGSSFGALGEDSSHIVKMVRSWGGFTTDAVLDPQMQVFSVPGIKGFVGYRAYGACLVVFGDPICEKTDRNVLAEAFHRWVDEQKKSIVYVAASLEFAKWAVGHICTGLVEFGAELTFDPPLDPRKKSGVYASLVRRKSKQAAADGVVITEYSNNDPELEKAIEGVAEKWLASRKGPQIHISNVYLFENRLGKRWFYAKKGDSIVGVIVLNQLQAHKGWHINHLMITPDAPNGTSEFLVATILESLEKEKCAFATVGAVTMKTLGEIQGLSKFSTWLGRLIFKLASKIMNLEGLYAFWGKFQPGNRPTYILFSRKKIGLREVLSLRRAMNAKL